MKNVIRTAVVAAALGLTVNAADFLTLGDNAEVFLTGTVGFRADDNVLLGANKTSDVITEFAPGFDLVFGNNSITKGHLFLKETITRYGKEENLNTELTSVGFTSNYDDEKTKMNFQAAWAQVAQNTVDINADFLVRRDVFNISGGSEISLTEKSSVGASISYDATDYLRAGFDDSQITTVPVNLYYEMSPKVDASFGVQFRNTSLNVGADSKDYFYNFGVRGEFTAKLKGTVAVGYTTRSIDKKADEKALGVVSSLTYSVSEKTDIRFGMGNDFGVSGQGASQRNTTYNVGIQTKASEDWSFGASASLRNIHYINAGGRSDRYLEGGVNATYIINAVANVVGGYTYRKNTTNAASGEFNNSVFSIAANLRF